nr:hypothetical protein [Lachnospiraceae bacterium]
MRKAVISIIPVIAGLMILSGCYAVPQTDTASEQTDVAGSQEETDRETDELKADETVNEAPLNTSQIKGSIAEITNYTISCEIMDGISVTGTYPRIDLSDEWAEKYPKLSESIDKLNDKMKYNTEDEVALYGGDAQSYFTSLADTDIAEADQLDQYSGMYMDVSCEVKRADDMMFSVLVWWSSYAGGAHPMHWTESYNFDPNTGVLLAASGIINDMNALSEIIYDEVMK